MSKLPISIVIPTYRRESVLVDTLGYLLRLREPAAEIIVMDQTPQHEDSTQAALSQLARDGKIIWCHLAQPSIPKAMNAGLMLASQPVLLFLDDDIEPGADLVAEHWKAHQRHPGALIAGRVTQPWDRGAAQAVRAEFSFASTESRLIREFMGGNFSIARDLALELGGMDENFVGVAYRFEAEFAHRLLKSGRTIQFVGTAGIDHLKASDGGTRTYGEHLTTWKPHHAVGAYYYALRTGRPALLFSRPLRAIATRYHLRHPWRAGATLLAEFSGLVWAVKLFAGGPRFVRRQPEEGPR